MPTEDKRISTSCCVQTHAWHSGHNLQCCFLELAYGIFIAVTSVVDERREEEQKRVIESDSSEQSRYSFMDPISTMHYESTGLFYS